MKLGFHIDLQSSSNSQYDHYAKFVQSSELQENSTEQANIYNVARGLIMARAAKKENEMNPIEEIGKISHHLPLAALQDIHQRITDYLASGGKHDDPYIFQQLRYAQRFVGREMNVQ